MSVHDSFLFDILGCAVPNHKKTELIDIINLNNVNFRKRARLILELLLNCFDEDPMFCPSLVTKSRIKVWFTNRMNDYCIKYYDDVAKKLRSECYITFTGIYAFSLSHLLKDQDRHVMEMVKRQIRVEKVLF